MIDFDQNGAVAGLRKRRQPHGWTCTTAPRDFCVFCSFEQSAVGSSYGRIAKIRMERAVVRQVCFPEKRCHCLGSWSLVQPGVHIFLAMS